MISRRELMGSSAACALLAAFSKRSAAASAKQAAQPFKIVALEEHVVVPPLQAGWSRLPDFQKTFEFGFGDFPPAQRLRDTGERRLRDMADQGVNMQVLSSAPPGVQNLSRDDAVPVARDVNDALAEIVKNRPDKFQAFATIPTPAPEAAAAELERAVKQLGFCGAMLFGRTNNVKPEDRVFDDLYSTAARLKVPLYFHPQIIVKPVQDAYYTGINDQVDHAFASGGVGWYYDLGVQILRMIFTGVFDRNPTLQVILGHWGEVVLFYLDRISIMEKAAHLPRPLIDYFRQNIWITGSGTQSPRYLRWTAEVVGVERMLYSSDYPYTFDISKLTGNQTVETSGGRARSFLEQSSFTPKEKEAIASGNWQRLIAPVTHVFE